MEIQYKLSITIRVNKDESHDIFCGRPSKYANPYKIGKDGSRKEVIEKFEKYIRAHPELNSLLNELEGKRISCWCSIDKNCHLDIFLMLLNERNRKDLLNEITN